MRRVAERHGLLALLWLAFLTFGGKTPEAFAAWALPALALIALFASATAGDLSPQRYGWEAALAVCLLVSWGFSKDRAQSLYPTAQAMLYLMLWITMRANPSLLPETSRWLAHLSGMALLSVLASLLQFARGPWRLVFGLFPVNPIFNAAWLAAIGAAGVAELLAVSAHRKTRWIVPCLILLVCLALPARSSLPALAAALCFASFPFWTFRRAAIFFGLIACIAVLAPRGLLYKRLRLNEGNYRRQLWSAAVQGAMDRPLVGYGLGNFELAYQRHAFPVETDPVRYSRTTRFAHNEYLQLAADGGWPAFFILLAIGVGWIVAARSINAPASMVPKTALIVLTTLAFYNIVWHLPILVLLTIVWAALLLKFGRRPEEPPRRRRPVLALAGEVLVLLTAVSLGWSALRENFARHGRWNWIVRCQPWDAEAWHQWAFQQADLARAVEGHAKAAALVPENAYYHEALAQALAATGRPENDLRAFEEYKRALREAPSRAVDALAIGRLFLITGKPPEALEWIRKARRIEPHYWVCDLWEARSLAALGKPCLAFQTLEHLRDRRSAYLTERESDEADLPSPPEPSDYSRLILGYDDRVVERELLALCANNDNPGPNPQIGTLCPCGPERPRARRLS